jgi:hypothetical protein
MSIEEEDHSGQRSLLRRLRQERAPWHFEARLKQRLAAGGRERKFSLMRPAYALPMAGAVAGFVIYFSFNQSGDVPIESPHTLDSTFRSVPSETGPEPVQPDTDPSIDMMEFSPSPQRGPSATGGDPFLPATLQETSLGIPADSQEPHLELAPGRK